MTTATRSRSGSSSRKVSFTRPALYPEQLAAIYSDKRYAICEASTKVGKTFGCLAWIIEHALQGKRGHEFWWVAPVSEQAAIAFNRLKLMLEPKDAYTVNETLRRVTLLPMGTVIAFKSADHPDALYGQDVYGLVVDEATRCKDDAWVALRSTITKTQGPVRVIGNVKGRKNWAYRLARQAESGDDPAMHYARLTAADAIAAGIFPAEELEDAKRRMPLEIFRQLYFAEAADDEGNPFGLVAIARNVLPDTDATTTWTSGRAVACWGIDLAESVDWAVAIGLDALGVVARLERWQGPWALTKAKILGLVDGMTPAWIDETGVGKSVVEDLQRERGTIRGYTFTPASKQVLMGGLVAAIQGDEVRYPGGIIKAELDSFEYVYREHGVRYQAMEGCHDDTVIALALAVYGRRPGGGAGMLAWTERQAKKLPTTTPEQGYRDLVQGVRGTPPQGPPPKRAARTDDRGEPPDTCPACGKVGLMRFTGSAWACRQCGAVAPSGGDGAD